ncbi:MAG TPA: MgtC/SapB family protein [Acholeplasma sp.]|nr:MgtC/SapB family protein [Acholeplasma sp.]
MTELELLRQIDIFEVIFMPFVVTIIVSSLLGLERQNIGKSAGISAHILIGMATMVIAIVQRFFFIEQGATDVAENQRLIAQIMPGVGFIGAGVIMKGEKTIIGLTTAATIWAVAIMGLIAGSGYWRLGGSYGLFLVLFIFIRDFKRGINPFVAHVHYDFLDSEMIREDDKRRHA